jgi:cysteine synthase A
VFSLLSFRARSKGVLGLIGNTPIISLKRMATGAKANIMVKVEYLNPSGSLKDRIALEMIEEAERQGVLRQGYTILESSTGNTGIALSLVGNVKGYKVLIFETIPGTMSEERVKMMEIFGARVKLVRPSMSGKKDQSVDGAEVELPGRKKCKELEATRHNVWWARQFSSRANVSAHKKTGREILTQTNGRIDAFVASIGTGGTLMGIAEVLRKEVPQAKIIGVQPASSRIPIVLDKPYPRSEISGGIIAEMLERKLIDEVVMIGDREAVRFTHKLWKEEGLFAGVSSGANTLVALKEARRLGEGKTVVTVLPDSGNRYIRDLHYIT